MKSGRSRIPSGNVYLIRILFLLAYFHLISLALKEVIPGIFFSPFSWINRILSDMSLMQSCRKWIKIFQSKEI